jgi:muramoyltetrapeptide carboxypeptidase
MSALPQTKTKRIAKALQVGDTVAIVSPAAPSTPEALSEGKALLERLGYNVKLMPHCGARQLYTAGTSQQRADDLMAAFTDPEVDAILCARGGYGSARLLPLLDFERLKAAIDKRPKLFMGFSDITVLLNVLYKECGLVGFYSPMLTSNLIEPNAAWTVAQWQRLLTTTQTPIEIANKDSYSCLQAGTAEGALLGGNLSLLASLCGTPWQPDFTGAIVFIEDWKERYYTLDRQFTQLIQAGLLNNIAGLLLCDFSQISNDFPEVPLAKHLKTLTAELNVPTGYGFSVGHGEQTATIPFGAYARLEAELGRLTVLEAPVT